MKTKEGFLLPFILGVILVMTLLFSSLLIVPLSLKKHTTQVINEIQNIYNSESSLLLFLNDLPQGLLDDLPVVYKENLGPFTKICAGENITNKVCLTTVNHLKKMNFSEWHKGFQAYRSFLRESLLFRNGLHTYSGNKRFFSIPEYSYIQILEGDLKVQFNGKMNSLNLVLSGNINIEGSIEFDTLRIYTVGDVFLRGNIKATFLEIVSGENLELSGNIEFKGLLLSMRNISLRGNIFGEFPSMAFAIGKNDPSIIVNSKGHFYGLYGSLPGDFFIQDSIMPSFFDGEKIPFERIIVK